MNEITIGDKTYISSKRAAEITGYAKDYVGQLCREGHVEAKMVGRGWYVYEPSIRAHRFGEEAVVAQEVPEPEESEVEEVNEAVEQEPIDNWEKPRYTPESQEILPELPTSSYEEVLPPAEESLTDMQAAWREWFERKQSGQDMPSVEDEEVVEEEIVAIEEQQEAEEAVEIPLHHIVEEVEEPHVYVEDEEPIAIRHIPEPVYAPVVDEIPARRVQSAVDHYDEPEARVVHERVIKKGSRKHKGGTRSYSHAPVVALLIGFSVLTIAVTVVGTGFVDTYLDYFGGSNPIINFLVGTSEYNRE